MILNKMQLSIFNKLRITEKINAFIERQKARYFSCLGTYAFKQGRLDLAEVYLIKAAGISGCTYRNSFLLGNVALRKGDLKTATARFLTAHYLKPEMSIFDEISLETLFVIACQQDRQEANMLIQAGESLLTSNLYPLPYVHELDLKLGDFASLSEYQRFQRLPPISEREISNIDLDKLLQALIGEAS